MIGVCYGAAAVLHLGKDQFFRLNIDEVHVVETALLCHPHLPQERCCLSRALTTLELVVGHSEDFGSLTTRLLLPSPAAAKDRSSSPRGLNLSIILLLVSSVRGRLLAIAYC